MIPALFRLQLEDQVSSLNRARIRTGYRLNLFFGLDLDPYCEWTPIQGFFITLHFRSFLFVPSFHGGFVINTLLKKIFSSFRCILDVSLSPRTCKRRIGSAQVISATANEGSNIPLPNPSQSCDSNQANVGCLWCVCDLQEGVLCPDLLGMLSVGFDIHWVYSECPLCIRLCHMSAEKVISMPL